MKHVVIKDGIRTAYVGLVNNPTFEVNEYMPKKRKRTIYTVENYIRRSGIEYCHRDEFLKVDTVKLLNILQGLHKYDKCR